MKIKRFGWIPDIPDKRDWRYKKLSLVKPTLTIPKIVNWKGKYTSKIVDQGELGSCTGCALQGMLEFIQIRNRKLGLSTIPFAYLSRHFIYYGERELEDSIDYDSGAYIRDGIKVLNKIGVCSENKCPYDVNRFTEKPSDIAYTEALKHTVSSYYRLDTLDDMRHCIADGYPFVFGFTVYESFMSDTVANTGIVPMPVNENVKENVIGGHAVMAVGYDDTVKKFNIRNSWGTEWGREGYFTMDYDYLTNRDLSDDFWTVRSFTAWA